MHPSLRSQRLENRENETVYQYFRFVHIFKIIKSYLDKIVKINPAFKNTKKVYCEAPLDPDFYNRVPCKSENSLTITLLEIIEKCKLG